MTPEQAIQVLSRSMQLIDAGVQQAGSFSPLAHYEVMKQLRKEHRAAVRCLKKLVLTVSEGGK